MVFGIIIAIVAIIAAVAIGAYALHKALSSSKEDADKSFSKCPVGGTAEPCPAKKTEDEKPKIVAVEFLDGDDKTELALTGKHFVNLPRDEKWKDGTHVLNIDRLSQKARFKVRFNKSGAYSFKVKYKPGGSNSAYTDTEKGRNSNFKFEESEKTYTTDSDGTKIIASDFFVTAAGKDSYQLMAKDNDGNEVQSHTKETHRFVYYQGLKMKGVPAASNLTTFVGEFTKHNITLVSLGSAEMEHMPNISTGDSDAFQNKARTAYNGSGASAKAPYVVAIGYTDHLAVKDASQTVVKSGVEVGPGKPDVEIPIVNGSGQSKYLWKNIVPSEGWFVSVKFRKDGSATDVAVPEADCAAVPADASVPDMCRKVKVKVSGLAAATGTITLTVNWVNRMRGGLSFGGGNLICVCTRAWWQAESTDDQNQVMIHEMGHKVGMVADGTSKGPDKTAKFYEGKGHVGPHCHQGLPVQDSYSGVSGSTCVMFGATNGITTFCADCTPAVRKVDLSSGWSAF